MKLRTVNVLLLFLLVSFTSYSDDYESWFSFGVDYDVNEKIGISLSNEDFVSTTEGLYAKNIYLLTEYKINRFIKSIDLGYKRESDNSDSKMIEDRILFDVNFDYKFSLLKFSIRNRGELRYFNKKDESFRNRHRLKVKSLFSDKFDLYVSSEIFKNSYDSSFKRNRSMFGIDYELFDIGFTNYIGTQFEMNHFKQGAKYFVGLDVVKKL
jgi:hypothetical protein